MKNMAEKLAHNPRIWKVRQLRQSLVVAWRLRLGAGHSFACFTYCNSTRDFGFLISAFLIIDPWFLTPLDSCIPIVQLSLSGFLIIIFILKYLRIYFQPVVTCNSLNMLDSIQKHFGCSQKRLGRKCQIQLPASSLVPFFQRRPRSY